MIPVAVEFADSAAEGFQLSNPRMLVGLRAQRGHPLPTYELGYQVRTLQPGVRGCLKSAWSETANE